MLSVFSFVFCEAIQDVLRQLDGTIVAERGRVKGIRRLLLGESEDRCWNGARTSSGGLSCLRALSGDGGRG